MALLESAKARVCWLAAWAALFGCDQGGGDDPCAGETCSGHGSCVVVDGAADHCECNVGYVEADGLTCVLGASDGDADADADAAMDGDVDEPAPDGSADADGPDSDVPTSALMGWAGVSGMGLETTTGGGELAPTIVTTLAELEGAVSGDAPAVVRISGAIEGTVRMGSNKTLEGEAGAVFTGSLVLDEVANVVMRNLTIVGYNCSDDDCGDGRDAITVYSAHHVWIDHCDISDGTDGNLDITAGSDFVTVSWTRFWYSGRRAGGHQLSNLVGASDDAPGDMGRLRVTWHDNWWADNVQERMPRIRYGQNHLFNNLYTSEGNNYCVGLGVFGDVLLENNVFIGVDDPINSTSYSNEESRLVSRGNTYRDTTGATDDFGDGVFTPPYPYTLADAADVEEAVRAGAGVLD